MNWQSKQKKLTFSDIIAQERPQDSEQVYKRWAFLKSEYENDTIIKEVRSISLSFIFVLLFIAFVFLLFLAIAV